MKAREKVKRNALPLPDHVLLVIHVTRRTRQASRIQAILTRYGDIIHTRLGLHDTHGGPGTPDGLIVLALQGPEKKMLELAEALKKVAGVDVTIVRYAHGPAR